MKRIIIGSCLMLIIFLLFSCEALRERDTQESLEEHIHNYQNGQCVDCNGIDESYCAPLYSDLCDKMRTFENFGALEDICSMLDSLPPEYKDVSSIKTQYDRIQGIRNKMKDQEINAITNEFLPVEKHLPVDFDVLRDGYLELLSLVDDYDYKWNLKSPLLNSFNTELSSYACSYLKGYYSNKSDYYFTVLVSKENTLMIKTNIPWNVGDNTEFDGWKIEYKDIYFVPSNSDSEILAFQIKDFTEDSISLYCYKNTTVYTLYYHPVGKICDHLYDNGYCLYCSHYDPSYKADPFSYLSEFLIQNGRASTVDHNLYNLTLSSNNATSISLNYNKANDRFTLIYKEKMKDDLSCEMYFSFDNSNACSFVSGLDQGSDNICAAVGKVNKSALTSTPSIYFDDYDGMKDMRYAFTDLCSAMIALCVNELDVYLNNNSSYTISDFGFDSFK